MANGRSRLLSALCVVVTAVAIAGCSNSHAGVAAESHDGRLSLQLQGGVARDSANAPTVWQSARPSVATIQVLARYVDQAGVEIESTSIATGTALTPRLLVTSAHVVYGAHRVSALLPSGVVVGASVVDFSRTKDLALLRLEGSGQTDLRPATWAAGRSLEVGQTVFALGAAAGEFAAPAFVSGLIEGLNRSTSTSMTHLGDAILTDASVSSGFSGGPLVDTNGRVIGVTTAVGQSSSGAPIPGLTYAIPSDDVANELKQVSLRAVQYPIMPTLGVAFVSGPRGLIVSSVQLSGPAAHANMRVGDRLVTLNRSRVRSTAQLQAILRNVHVGSAVKITVDRRGQRLRLVAHLGNADAPS